MAEISPAELGTLNDQQWRRLGITQTFDRLLVEAVIASPGATDMVRNQAGQNLTGGAAKFWEMSFPQILQDLCRRQVLAKRSGEVQLSDEFADKLARLVDEEKEAVSHVAPTPGVTLEHVLHQVEARQEREKAKKESARRASRRTAAQKKKKGEAAPRKRGAGKTGPTAKASPRAPAVRSAPARTPAAKLFTTLRVDKLLSALDTGTLSQPQVGTRLSLTGDDLDRFLQVSDALGITRRDNDLVELHWEGRQIARIDKGDRRLALIETVKKLRGQAEEIDV